MSDLLNQPGRPCDCTACTQRFAPYAHRDDYDPALAHLVRKEPRR